MLMAAAWLESSVRSKFFYFHGLVLLSQMTDIKCRRWVLNPGLPVRERYFFTSGLLGKTDCRRSLCRNKSKLGGSDNSKAGSLNLILVFKEKQKISHSFTKQDIK